MQWVIAGVILLCLSKAGYTAEPQGLITVPSTHSVAETIQRYEAAVNASAANGWMVFTEIDHAAAARQAGLTLRPRTVIIFGNPKIGTPSMQQTPTVAIDVPLKALVLQDDQDKVWLSYNSGDYLRLVIYPRHGLPADQHAADALTGVLAGFAKQATQ
jgi:uncharacterized protein (DUF302 family)